MLQSFCSTSAWLLSKGLEAIRVEMALGTVSVYGLFMCAIIVGVQDCSGAEFEVTSQGEIPLDLDQSHARARAFQ